MARDSNLPKWTKQSSEYVISDRWLKLSANHFVTPDGANIDPYYIAEYSNWVSVLAIDADLSVYTLRHYRPAANEYIHELVSGTIDPEDPNPRSTTIRELEEELGYTGGEIISLGSAHPNPAIQTNTLHMYLAVGGSRTQLQNLESGENLIVEPMKFATFAQRFTRPNLPEMYQVNHLATIFSAFNYIKHCDNPSPTIKKLRDTLYEIDKL